MQFQMRSTGTYGTMEVFDSVTGNVHYRGPGLVAAAELAKLNLAERVSVARTAAEKARDRQEAKERGNHGGFGVSRSGRR